MSTGEAARRLVSDGANWLPGHGPKPTLAIVREVVTEPMFLMLLTAGGLYLLLGDPAEAFLLLGFVFVVIGMTLYQERRTQRALEALRDLSAPRALVLRDGVEQRVAGHEVVRGDVLVLHEGDLIAADARLLQGEVEVDESLLTGESVPVARAAQDDALLYASTLVTRGMALAEVVSTAGRTAVGRIGADLAQTIEPPSALQQASRRLVRRVGLLALFLAATQALLSAGWNAQTPLDALLSGIALAMAILPQEIPMILTAFLALGALRIARRRVLTRRITAVETLGAITTLAVDKTGTLTMNRMTVVELSCGPARFRPADADGTAAAGPVAPMPARFADLLESALLATPHDPFDPMEKAIRRFGLRWLPQAAGAMPALKFEYPLTREMLAMTRVFDDGAPRHHRLATKGAPEAVADLCHLDAGAREALQREVGAMAARGLRVLAVARGRWVCDEAGSPAAPTRWPIRQHDFDFEFLGLVALADPPRPDVPEALQQCRGAGVRVLMMTGDHPATACAIARQIGLSEQPDAMTGIELDALDDAALTLRLRRADLCARLRPDQKLRIVRVLRAAGEVVAMTGDGVNDAPALKAADVGIAMGERGTDVAREAAALVLLDDSFARIVETIRQGRRIYDNIGKATRFVFAVHVPVVALALVPTLAHWPALILPVHIVLLELLIDPACSVVFEAEPTAPQLMSRPPRERSETPFGAGPLLASALQGLGVAAALLGASFWMRAQAWGAGPSRAVTLCSLVLSVVLLILANRDPARSLLANARTPNPWLRRMVLAVAVLLGLLLAVPPVRGLLEVDWPALSGAGVTIATLCAAIAWLELLRLASRRRRRRPISPPASPG